MKTRKQITSKAVVIFSVIGAAALVISIATLGFLGMGNGAMSPNDTSWASKTLVGTWHETPETNLPLNMVADISNDHISITMYASQPGDSFTVSGLYWDGTFDAHHDLRNPFSIVSVANRDVMKGKAMTSHNNTKTFTYNNGQLSYDFTALGVTSTVYLARGE
jgi:hypothetical protein